MADRCSICGLYLESMADLFDSTLDPVGTKMQMPDGRIFRAGLAGAIGSVGHALTEGVYTKFRLIMKHRNHAHIAKYEHVEGTLSDNDLFAEA